MKKFIAMAAIISLTVISTGCTQHLGNFTAMSSSNFNSKNINSKHLKKRNISGRTKSLFVIGIPLQGQPKIDQAVSETLSKCDGDFLQNARLYMYWWTALVIAEIGYKVEADCYKTN